MQCYIQLLFKLTQITIMNVSWAAIQVAVILHLNSTIKNNQMHQKMPLHFHLQKTSGLEDYNARDQSEWETEGQTKEGESQLEEMTDLDWRTPEFIYFALSSLRYALVANSALCWDGLSTRVHFWWSEIKRETNSPRKKMANTNPNSFKDSEPCLAITKQIMKQKQNRRTKLFPNFKMCIW